MQSPLLVLTEKGEVASTSEARKAGTSHLAKAEPSDGPVPPETESQSTTTGDIRRRD